jgi:hypothetical protein
MSTPSSLVETKQHNQLIIVARVRWRREDEDEDVDEDGGKDGENDFEGSEDDEDDENGRF